MVKQVAGEIEPLQAHAVNRYAQIYGGDDAGTKGLSRFEPNRAHPETLSLNNLQTLEKAWSGLHMDPT
jgi:hypothetical protein